MHILQTNVLITEPNIQNTILELLAAVQPPVLIRSFNSEAQLMSYLIQSNDPKRQILISNSYETIRTVQRSSQYMAAIHLGKSDLIEPNPGITVVNRVPSSDELVEAIQAAYRIAEHQYKLQTKVANVSRLGEREMRIIELAVEGTPNKAIANKLGISVKTVEKNRRKAYLKLNVSSAAEMASVITYSRFCNFPVLNPTPPPVPKKFSPPPPKFPTIQQRNLNSNNSSQQNNY